MTFFGENGKLLYHWNVQDTLCKKRVINHCGKNMHTAKKRSKAKVILIFSHYYWTIKLLFRRKKRRRGCNKKKTDKESSRREEGYNKRKNVQKSLTTIDPSHGRSRSWKVTMNQVLAKQKISDRRQLNT